MDKRAKASIYFDEVVKPAIDELIGEYDRKEGYKAGYCPYPILFRDKPPLVEHNGISITFPNSTQKNISVCWFEGGERIMISRIDRVLGGGAHRMYAIQDADKEFVKERVRELIVE